MTDFTLITACGECCTSCAKKADGRCPGTVCLEKGVLLDVFTPKRDDFLKA